ncbi:M10 family metallopeptidase C-terminal domain-containing protein [Microvirga ossetica]|nr:M10 family metallopeptidase C-terminal domain-containing protein [Microvirga ossetica]
MNALEHASQIANINLSGDSRFYVEDVPNANLVVWSLDMPNWTGGAIWASADSPQESFAAGRDQSWLYLNTFDYGAWEVPHKGGMGYTMMLNLLGSALGLEQAHNAFPGVTSAADPGPLGLNQVPFTVMTANWRHDGFGHPEGDWGSMKSFGAFDIAALQKIYGANMATATGNNVYTLPTWNFWNGVWGTGDGTGWTCIWDAGGVDTISGQGSTKSVTIDLRAATLATGDPNAGGYLSRQTDVAGGFTIANGVVIENAIGGNGNDTLIGNSAANRLEGGAGDDIYHIDSPNDVVVDTSGNDTVYSTFNFSAPGIENVFVNGVKVVSGGVVTGNGFNPIKGTAGKNTLVGKDTNDKLYGGLGNDTLTGKGGIDIFVFDTKPNKSTNRDKITDFSVRDDTIWLDNKIFKKLGSKGSESNPATLKASFFKISDKAKDRDDYLIYNKKTGVLSYDADGSGKGQAVEFAVLKKNLLLKYDDFAVI